MGSTRDPLVYTFSHRPAKHILRWVHEGSDRSHEALRRRLQMHPQAFQRMLERLARFDLVAIRAPHRAEFDDGRIRVVLEITDKGTRMLRLLEKLDQVIQKHPQLVPAATRSRLLGP